MTQKAILSAEQRGDVIHVTYGNVENDLPVVPIGAEGACKHECLTQAAPRWFIALWRHHEQAMRHIGFRLDTYPDTRETVIAWKPRDAGI